MHLRDDLPGLIAEPGTWSLLGGGREPGDRSLAETIQRELREEAGLVIPNLEPFAVERLSPAITVQIFTGRWDGDPPRWSSNGQVGDRPSELGDGSHHRYSSSLSPATSRSRSSRGLVLQVDAAPS